MARLARPTTNRGDDGDADEFPDIATLGSRKGRQAQEDSRNPQPNPQGRARTQAPAKSATTVRRRKLGPLTNNLLLKGWNPDNAEDERDGKHTRQKEEESHPQRTRVGLRTRGMKPAVVIPSSPGDRDEEFVSAQEEVTIIEEVSMMDDSFHSCNSEGSEFEFRNSDYGDSEDEDENFPADHPTQRPAAKQRFRTVEGKWLGPGRRDAASRGSHGLEEEESDTSGGSSKRDAEPRPSQKRGGQGKANKANRELVDGLSRLRLDEGEKKPQRSSSPRSDGREATPPSIPQKSQPGLLSPTKLPRIPATPHRPSSDIFWSQEFVDDWNDEHSPRKQLFPDPMTARQRSPTKQSPEKKSQKGTAAKNASEREMKKAFEKAKHELAERFLKELDTVITDGRLADLAVSTGGIKLIWTNKLNTTAGRANWKRETIRSRPARPSPNVVPTPETILHKHHASIELAEKVIDDEHRLLNVLAHEFCHLANFMITGVTTNPHGREFKAWAARCSAAFAHRGVQVTTKHSYEIDFKYVWACAACGSHFKRHSRSIDPARHRCGSCRGELRQIKPVPRAKKSGDDGDDDKGMTGNKKVSKYQAFVKEQMRVVREENPKSPQKDIMKIVASRWAQRPKESMQSDPVQKMTEGLGSLAV